jgi:DDE superfamily endonuclease
VSAEYVAAMEDVLEVYAEPYDPKRPKVNFDETSKQLIKETRSPLPPQPGKPQRFDYEYERNGTRNLFLFVEPQAGWRHVEVTEQRTKLDFAHQMQWLVNERYPEAEVIRVTLDNLNTHKLASLYEAFEPAEARRIARKLEFHYTPKHGSWLNMAEIELSVLQQQCLDRRIPDADPLQREIAAWEYQRNAEQATIDWRFSVTDARKKLERLYPSLPS